MNENVHVGGSEAGHDWPRARLPLNSKRLTAEQIKRVGRALSVPTDASVDEVRVMIKGKLREMERDPANVQVVVGTTGLSLWGEDGEFLAVAEQPSEDTRYDSEGEQNSSNEHPGDDDVHEMQQLEEELQGAKAEILSLTETIETLQTQLSEHKDRIREMWRSNCRYVTEVDEELASKDAEIQRLQEQIQGMEVAVSEVHHSPVVPPIPVVASTRPTRRGKAPPVDSFSGEDAETTMDDWLPSLQRAAEWNS